MTTRSVATILVFAALATSVSASVASGQSSSTPAASVADSDRLVVRARLVALPEPVPPCGRAFFQTVAHFEIATIENGTHAGRDLYVVLGCPERFAPSVHDPNRVVLRAGDDYRLVLRRGLSNPRWRVVAGLSETVRRAGYYHDESIERIATP